MKKDNNHFINSLSDVAQNNSSIDSSLFGKYEVKRGLRNLDGRGVLVGLTKVGDVHSYILDEGEIVPVPGRLRYQGFDVSDLTNGFINENRLGFEETTYLLLFGELPTPSQLEEFKSLLSSYYKLPDYFVRNSILDSPSPNVMNALARGVLSLYCTDENPDDTSIPNTLRQCIQLIGSLPTMAVYAFQAYSHYHKNKSLFIHAPQENLSIAENILHMLRPNSEYTPLEARLLDLSLILHAEHGGGNNSTFTTHLVTSTGTDTYSVMAAAIGSLKGPRHGGANFHVIQMIEHMKQNIKDWTDDDEISNYLHQILDKKVFDKAGLIYGIGHAVYSISDPRAVILKDSARALAAEKGLLAEFNFYAKIEALAPQVISENRKMYKPISANVDFYSGFVYSMLDLPLELYTPLFAISRMAGWSAHRLEEIINRGKIIRPAYKNVAAPSPYSSLEGR